MSEQTPDAGPGEDTRPSSALPTVSVVVPSYRRPELLTRCLAGLATQEHPADEVVVVRRDDDELTAAVLAAHPWVHEVLVREPGVLAAMRAGVAATTSAVIAFTDDDAVPRPEWLATLLPFFADERVGGVGGRDIAHPQTLDADRPSSQVGRFTSWGRHLGNHHVGVGAVTVVEVLKGVNMAYRREALGLPVSLAGSGAQVHFEILTAAWARARGWVLLYVPHALVDHHHGPRFDSDKRHRPDPVAVRNEAHNLVVAMLYSRPELFLRRALYGLAVGDKSSPGLLRAGIALARREHGVARRLRPSLAGQVSGLVAVARRRFPDVERPAR